MMILAASVIAALIALLPQTASAQQDSLARSLPVIDMHIHDGHGTTAAEWSSILSGLDSNRVVLATLFVNNTSSSPLAALAPERFLLGASFPCYNGVFPRGDPCFPNSRGWPDLQWLRAQFKAGRMQVMGELLNVYYGISPDDPLLEPYWSLAEELDIPVGIHTGRGPGPADRAPGCCPRFNDDYGNPALLEPVLQRHPHLRVWLMHGGGIFMDQTIALMKAHSNVYADMSVINSVAPAPVEEMWLRRMRSAGLLDRIMFGSDNWALDKTIARSRDVPFLSNAERRAILCGNAARFLRLNEAVCAIH